MKIQKRNTARRYAGLSTTRAIAATIALSTAFALTVSPSTARAEKSCQELGGTPVSSGPETCNLKVGFSPFEATFTGKFDTNAFNPEPSAVFKVTSKFDRPVSIFTTRGYVYDKAGNQIAFVLRDERPKSWMYSKAGLLTIAPGETKTLVFPLRKEHVPPEMAALEIEILAWTGADGKPVFARHFITGQDSSVRPKGGWK